MNGFLYPILVYWNSVQGSGKQEFEYHRPRFFPRVLSALATETHVSSLTVVRISSSELSPNSILLDISLSLVHVV